METKVWRVYNHRDVQVGMVEAASEAEALQKVAVERGYRNTDEAQAASKYYVEEVDA